MDTIKLVIVALGCLIVAVGVGAVYWPAGVIVGGVLTVAFGALLQGDGPAAAEKTEGKQ